MRTGRHHPLTCRHCARPLPRREVQVVVAVAAAEVVSTEASHRTHNRTHPRTRASRLRRLMTNRNSPQCTRGALHTLARTN